MSHNCVKYGRALASHANNVPEIAPKLRGGDGFEIQKASNRWRFAVGDNCTLAGLIHILLVLAIVAIVVRVIQRRRL